MIDYRTSTRDFHVSIPKIILRCLPSAGVLVFFLLFLFHRFSSAADTRQQDRGTEAAAPRDSYLPARIKHRFKEGFQKECTPRSLRVAHETDCLNPARLVLRLKLADNVLGIARKSAFAVASKFAP